MLIGDVSRRTGVSARMLRHYDKIGLVSPTGRTSGGYREYSAADIRRLFAVESLRTLGLSLADVNRAMDEPDFAPTELVRELITHTRAQIAAQQDLLADLERIAAVEPAQWTDVLRTVGLLRALASDAAGHRQQAALNVDDPAALSPSDVVAALLAENDENVAGALRWALARVPGHGSAELTAALDSPDRQVRRRAVVALDGVPGDEGCAALTVALDDADPDVAHRAALSLGRRGAAGAVPALLRMVVDGDRDVEAAEVLAALVDVDAAGAADVVGDLARLAATTADPAARLRITQAVAEIPDDAARRLLVDLTEDTDHLVAGTAAAILRARDSLGRSS